MSSFLYRELRLGVPEEKWDEFEAALTTLLRQYGGEPKEVSRYPGVPVTYAGQSPRGNTSIRVLKLPNSEVAKALADRQKAYINAFLSGFTVVQVEQIMRDVHLHNWKHDIPLRGHELEPVIRYVSTQRTMKELKGRVHEPELFDGICFDTARYWGRNF